MIHKLFPYLCKNYVSMEYKNRIADKLLRDKLEAMGAVLIEGPKACGKTTTAEQQAKSIIYMDDPVKQESINRWHKQISVFCLKEKLHV